MNGNPAFRSVPVHLCVGLNQDQTDSGIWILCWRRGTRLWTAAYADYGLIVGGLWY